MMVYVWYSTDQNATFRKKSAPHLPGLDEAISKISPGDISDMFRPATDTLGLTLLFRAAVTQATLYYLTLSGHCIS
jgi:hypothetical protein